MSENSSEDSGKHKELTDLLTENESEIWNSEDERNAEKKNSRGAKRNHWLAEVSSFTCFLIFRM